jgi:hypothetical protein
MDAGASEDPNICKCAKESSAVRRDDEKLANVVNFIQSY